MVSEKKKKHCQTQYQATYPLCFILKKKGIELSRIIKKKTGTSQIFLHFYSYQLIESNKLLVKIE